MLLAFGGNVSQDKCVVEWEKIVKRNAEENGRNDYSIYFDLYKAYSILLAEYVLVKSLLTYLCYVIDYTYIKRLRKMGYKVDTTNSTTYTESLTSGLKRSENLNTKITSKQKEMEAMLGPIDKNKVEPMSIEQTIAQLNLALGFVETTDITLARFNEYRKVLRERNKPKV